MQIMLCKCNRRVLTGQQMADNLPCGICQQEVKKHAEEFPKKFKELGKDKNGEVKYGLDKDS